MFSDRDFFGFGISSIRQPRRHSHYSSKNLDQIKKYHFNEIQNSATTKNVKLGTDRVSNRGPFQTVNNLLR